MNEHRMLKHGLTGFSAALALLLGTAAAFARSAPASLGHQLNGIGCVTETNYGGAVMNSDLCGKQTYRVPLVTDYAGLDTIIAYATSGPTSKNLSCQAFSMTNGAGSWVAWSWSPRIVADPGSPQALYLPVTIPAHGTAFVDCDMGPGSWISTVEW